MSSRDAARISSSGGGGGLGTSLLSERDRRQLVAQVNSGEIVKRDDGMVTDKEGRRRFHGAFTGGYSAGYFNTVGSAEGWKPSTFVSSRSKRATRREQTPQEFMDDEDGETIGGRMAVRSEYAAASGNARGLSSVALGPTTASLDLRNRRPTSVPASDQHSRVGGRIGPAGRPAVTSTASSSSSAVVDLVPRDLIAPVGDVVGKRLLRAMGWREGQGVGPKERAPLRGRVMSDGKLDPHAAGYRFTPRDTSVRVATPMTGVFGLGYAPDAEVAAWGSNNNGGGASAAGVHSQGTKARASRFASIVDIGERDEEDDDESMVYHTEDKSAYLRVLDSGRMDQHESNTSRFGNHRGRGRGMMASSSGGGGTQRSVELASLLDSLVLATDTVAPKRVVAPPNVPRDFVPSPDLEEYAAAAGGRGTTHLRGPAGRRPVQMSSNDRGLALGEKPLAPQNPMAKVIPGSLASRFSKAGVGASSASAPAPGTVGEGTSSSAAASAATATITTSGGMIARTPGLQLHASLRANDESDVLVSNVTKAQEAPKRTQVPKVERTASVWHTEKLLCRRFDVAMPTHSADQLRQLSAPAAVVAHAHAHPHPPTQQAHHNNPRQQQQNQHQQRNTPGEEVQRAPSNGQDVIPAPEFKLAEASLFDAVFNTGADDSSSDEDDDDDEDEGHDDVRQAGSDRSRNHIGTGHNTVSATVPNMAGGNPIFNNRQDGRLGKPQPVFTKSSDRWNRNAPGRVVAGNQDRNSEPTRVVAEVEAERSMVAQERATGPLMRGVDAMDGAREVSGSRLGPQPQQQPQQQHQSDIVRVQPTPDMPSWLQRAIVQEPRAPSSSTSHSHSNDPPSSTDDVSGEQRLSKKRKLSENRSSKHRRDSNHKHDRRHHRRKRSHSNSSSGSRRRERGRKKESRRRTRREEEGEGGVENSSNSHRDDSEEREGEGESDNSAHDGRRRRDRSSAGTSKKKSKKHKESKESKSSSSKRSSSSSSKHANKAHKKKSSRRGRRSRSREYSRSSRTS
jgi:hypothetical protein